MANKKGKKKAEVETEEDSEVAGEYVTLTTLKAMLAAQENVFKGIVDSLVSSTIVRMRWNRRPDSKT